MRSLSRREFLKLTGTAAAITAMNGIAPPVLHAQEPSQAPDIAHDESLPDGYGVFVHTTQDGVPLDVRFFDYSTQHFENLHIALPQATSNVYPRTDDFTIAQNALTQSIEVDGKWAIGKKVLHTPWNVEQWHGTGIPHQPWLFMPGIYNKRDGFYYTQYDDTLTPHVGHWSKQELTPKIVSGYEAGPNPDGSGFLYHTIQAVQGSTMVAAELANAGEMYKQRSSIPLGAQIPLPTQSPDRFEHTLYHHQRGKKDQQVKPNSFSGRFNPDDKNGEYTCTEQVWPEGASAPHTQLVIADLGGTEKAKIEYGKFGIWNGTSISYTHELITVEGSITERDARVRSEEGGIIYLERDLLNVWMFNQGAGYVVVGTIRRQSDGHDLMVNTCYSLDGSSKIPIPSAENGQLYPTGFIGKNDILLHQTYFQALDQS